MAKASDEAIKEIIEKALNIYDVPETCIIIALAYIEGLKTGALQGAETINN